MKLMTRSERTCIRCRVSFPLRGNSDYCEKCVTGQHGDTLAINVPAKFVAIDGENITAHPDSPYGLLGMGTEPSLENPNRNLTFDEILTYLWSHFDINDPKIIYIGFFLAFDFNNWFQTLPEERAKMLLTQEGKQSRKWKRGYHVVRYNGWEFDCIGMKQFKFRKAVCECAILPNVHQRKVWANGITHCCDKPWEPHCDHKQNPYMCINDVGPFWQSSFLKVINRKKWVHKDCDQCVTKKGKENPCKVHEPCTKEEYAIIEEGKKNRPNAPLDDKMRTYNNLENEILARVMSMLDGGFREMGVKLNRSNYYGPGQAAQTWLNNENMVTRYVLDGCASECERKHLHNTRIVPEWFRLAAQVSYYGGRFEIMVHGVIPGLTYEYDINSAYPNIIYRLPCLQHALYTKGNGKPPKLNPDEFCLVKVAVGGNGEINDEFDDPPFLGTLPFRNTKGGISWPLIIRDGWYWLHEIKASEKAGCIGEVQYKEWMKLTPSCDCELPLRKVKDLYEDRLKAGKETPLGKARKNVYNSIYGKFAQSIGAARYGNPIYASLITSGCRIQILDAIRTHPQGKEAVAMIATDAVFFLTEHPKLEKMINEKLGNWERTVHEELTLFKPGVYWNAQTLKDLDLENPDLSFKARGVNAKSFAKELRGLAATFRSWQLGKIRKIPETTYNPEFAIISCLQALQRGDWSLAAKTTNGQECKLLKQSARWTNKRGRELFHDSEREIWRSHPIVQWTDGITKPYEKRFGLEDPFSDESLAIAGITPDGYGGTELIGIINGG